MHAARTHRDGVPSEKENRIINHDGARGCQGRRIPMTAIVLLPGMDGSGALFTDFAMALEKNLRPVIVSYPGNRPFSYRELEEFARSHLPANEPYILLAESFSGPVAIALAAARPPGLVGLVLCCTFARNPLPALSLLKGLTGLVPVNRRCTRWAMRFLFGRFASASLRHALTQAIERTTVGVLRKRLGEVLAVDYTEKLQHIQVPVLYLQASEDRIIPRSALRIIAGQTPFLQSVTLEAPHLLLQAIPTTAARIVAQYADGTVAAFSKAAIKQPQAPASVAS